MYGRKIQNIKRPCKLQGRKEIRDTTLLCIFFAEYALLTSQPGGEAQGLKSLSDVTVAPVVPTAGSAHCSQNELHLKSGHCLAPPGNSLRPSFRLLFLLKRIWHMKNVELIIALSFPSVKHFCSPEENFFHHAYSKKPVALVIRTEIVKVLLLMCISVYNNEYWW